MSYDFYELIGQQAITVPAIQRDFAQGRDTATEIRSNFLDKLREVLSAAAGTPAAKLHLDFVYGYIEAAGHFVPLDGQQRLTTLFLLHWYAAAREARNTEAAGAIAHILSRFSYETRVSSKRFCKQLVAHPELVRQSGVLSSLITDASWFVASWIVDPTVKAMLNMLDAIQQTFVALPDLWTLLTTEKRITFEFIDIKSQEFRLTDELYIKMNSRGKPLSPFENFKAQLTGMLEGSAFQDLTLTLQDAQLSYKDYFAISIDGRWMDLFWKHFTPDEVDDALTAFIRFIAEMLHYQQGQEEEEDFKGDSTSLARIFQQPSHALFLIHSLDFLTGLPDLKRFFNELFALDNTDGNRLRLFDSHDTDLFRLSITDPTFEARNKILLFAVLYFGIRHGATDQDRLRQALRLLRNLLGRIRQVNTKDRIRFGSNLRLPNFKEHYQFLVQLSEQWGKTADSIWTVFNNHNWKGFTKEQFEAEKCKAALLTEHPELASVLHQLEDHEQIAGITDNFDLAHEGLRERIAAFLDLWHSGTSDSLLIRSLLCYQDHTVETHDNSAMGNVYYFGSKGNWNRILTTLYVKEQVRVNEALNSLLTDYAALREGDRAEKQRLLISRYQAEEQDWRYYFIIYPEMTSAYYERFNLFAWSWNNDFQIHSLGNAGRQPLASYHLNPFIITLFKKLNNEKRAQIYYGRFTDPSFIRLTGKGDLYMQADGWRLQARKDAVPDELAAKYELEVSGNEYLLKDHDQQDRIQRALDFCKELMG